MLREEAIDTMGATLDDWVDKKNMHMLIDKIYDEHEAQIEALQQPKSCHGCEQSWEPNNQTFHKYFCNYLQIPVHGNFCCNRHEPKGLKNEHELL